MVFSIMGLFGVELNPEAFGVDDRVRATMALAQTILRKGGSAQRIGIATKASPCAHLSTFPSFPQTTVSWPGKLQTWDGELVLSETAVDADSLDDSGMDSDLDDDSDGQQALRMLKAKEPMDDNGYLLVESRGCVVSAATADVESAAQNEGRFARAVDGKLWEFLGGPQAVTIEEADSRGLLLFSSPSSPSKSDLDACKFMLVTEHVPGRFHVASYFYLHVREDFRDGVWSRKVSSWGTCNVLLGGPRASAPVPQSQ
ncbi:hypothetical protein QBC43DRAFT_360770 [Cladorrhinum sp. PSN259]|nr:hypothetical protein QBC43DRAFT_360770 [Cladorrhinum sp. PSN259]